jgi:uncharacterized OB-fold protein
VSNHEGKFLPSPKPATRPYWEACKRHELLLQECSQCGVRQFYPRTICASCSAAELHWVRASGSGTVVSWTVVRHPVSPAYAADIPYVVALIELDEGPTMMAQIVDCEPESVGSGMPVEVCFEDWTEEISMPNFRARSNTEA